MPRRSSALINVRALLAAVAIIHTSRHITQRKLSEKLGVSRPTIARLLRNAKRHCEVDIIWQKNGHPGEHGQYIVRSFGVLDPQAVIAWAKRHGYL